MKTTKLACVAAAVAILAGSAVFARPWNTRSVRNHHSFEFQRDAVGRRAPAAFDPSLCPENCPALQRRNPTNAHPEGLSTRRFRFSPEDNRLGRHHAHYSEQCPYQEECPFYDEQHHPHHNGRSL